MNCSCAAPSTFANPHAGAIGQVLCARSKHSTRFRFGSHARTTAPTVIAAAGRASCMPPPRPRVAATKPVRASRFATFVR